MSHESGLLRDSRAIPLSLQVENVNIPHGPRLLRVRSLDPRLQRIHALMERLMRTREAPGRDAKLL